MMTTKDITPNSDLDMRTVRHHKDGKVIEVTFPSKKMKDEYVRDSLSHEMAKFLSERA